MRRILFLSILVWFCLSAAVPPLPVSPNACSQAYGANLPDPLPGWLQPVEQPADLQTSQSFELLAGHLLKARHRGWFSMSLGWAECGWVAQRLWIGSLSG